MVFLRWWGGLVLNDGAPVVAAVLDDGGVLELAVLPGGCEVARAGLGDAQVGAKSAAVHGRGLIDGALDAVGAGGPQQDAAGGGMVFHDGSLSAALNAMLIGYCVAQHGQGAPGGDSLW